ncbi:hypothetical protein A1OE_795 [Candidatus Endolissoclinum faulkneri L2]|uniref:Uncharacterized protein n=1 Tax=Candidatus Endolissoclinum faulkneri L2 TaxID=1193729 RepID=K7YHF3_9PROT|nr:hypothetical protein A1OE_795 [Candidatus Endolissoclinum faulkneri L2]
MISNKFAKLMFIIKLKYNLLIYTKKTINFLIIRLNKKNYFFKK